MSNLCDAKKFYDTAFEAEVAAAKSSFKFQADMTVYKCLEGNHWHIANTDPSLRSRVRTYKKTFCQTCNQYMKAKTYPKHVQTQRHLYLARKRQEESI